MLVKETLNGLMRFSKSWKARGPRACPYLFVGIVLCCPILATAAEEGCNERVSDVKLQLDEGHEWRPPFGLDRVGQPINIDVEVKSDRRLLREYYVVGFVGEQEVERQVLRIRRRTFDRPDSDEVQHGGTATASLESYPEEVVLSSLCRFEGEALELARLSVPFPRIQAAAVARPSVSMNPVDLGAIFVPHDWLILGPGQKAELNAAAIAYGGSHPQAKLVGWFESQPDEQASVPLAVQDREVSRASLVLDGIQPEGENDVLHAVLLTAQGEDLWHQTIQTMYVANPPKLPAFGATELNLRYDPPISINTAGGGELEFTDYDSAWAPHLKDVVVSLPNGSRFVFWRGSSYIPFWAGKHNTGMCYEWAETTPPPDGFVDAIEPLMDKELRYGRVEIIEATPARVHVRWTYQSTDFTYKVWGAQAVEDFYFYPDGFGTRVLDLKRKPGTEYELSEFIVLTPQSAYPLEVLPKTMVDMIYLDGDKWEFSFPDHALYQSTFPDALHPPRNIPAVYRIRLHKDETVAAVYFHPSPNHYPMGPFAPFHDRGYLVTPAYWGSHWPLSRGKTTGWSIDDRIHYSPAHNSLLTWGVTNRPIPITSGNVETINTLGQAEIMTVERWSWLIGMSGASDARLIEWAHSFSRPPSVEVSGAEFDYVAYSPERRSIRLRVPEHTVSMTLKPVIRTVNPVFELIHAPQSTLEVVLGGKVLPQDRYAWDGETLWIEATIGEPTQLQLRFAAPR